MVAAALAGAVATAACGVGAGSSSPGDATLTVTRDYGTQTLASARRSDPAESETVMRLLDRGADIQTRYGGEFVQSIDGIEGSSAGSRRRDWFFYVNGIESAEGAGAVRVRGGDRVWWDYRDWTDVMRVPAVVGSWPQPFAAKPARAHVDCRGRRVACEAVAAALQDFGVHPERRSAEDRAGSMPRLIVGRWSAVRRDRLARQVETGPDRSGVFADYRGGRFVGLDEQSRAARRLSLGAGLVAALREGDGGPTWIVTGVRDSGVMNATGLLTEAALRNRYAVATESGRTIPLPVR